MKKPPMFQFFISILTTIDIKLRLTNYNFDNSLYELEITLKNFAQPSNKSEIKWISELTTSDYNHCIIKKTYDYNNLFQMLIKDVFTICPISYWNYYTANVRQLISKSSLDTVQMITLYIYTEIPGENYNTIVNVDELKNNNKLILQARKMASDEYWSAGRNENNDRNSFRRFQGSNNYNTLKDPFVIYTLLGALVFFCIIGFLYAVYA